MGSVLRFYVAMNEFLGVGYDAALSNLFYSAPSPAPPLPSAASMAELLLSPMVLCVLRRPRLAHSAQDELSVYRALYMLLPDLWTLWELLLVGEALMVFCQTPTQVWFGFLLGSFTLAFDAALCAVHRSRRVSWLHLCR